MSILKDLLPGQEAQQFLDTSLANGNGFINPGNDLDTTVNNALEWYANPANTPQYYTGNTVQDFTDDQLIGQEGRKFAANEMDALTRDMILRQQMQGDPTGAYANQLADQAIAGVNRGWGATGTMGSARNTRAATTAATNTINQNQQNSFSNIRGLKGDLAAGSNIHSDVGKEQHKYLQDRVNEDIKRWNYSQQAPGTQVDKILGIQTAKEGLKYPAGTSNAQQADDGNWYDPITGALVNAGTNYIAGNAGDWLDTGLDWLGGSDWFNEGGPVYRNDGSMQPEGMIPQGDGIMSGEAPMEAPMDPMMMEEGAMPPMEGPQGAGIMNGMTPEGMSMEPMEEMSELDKIEATLLSAVEAGGLDVTITRKTKPKGGK